jgi:Protein of unknown function (DUF3999)
MKLWLLTLLLLQLAPAANDPPVAQPSTMRYVRTVHLPDAPTSGQACAVIDGATYSHAAPALADLRIFPANPSGNAHEVPYAVTLSDAVTEETESAHLLNLGARDGRIEFDLEMPNRAYTDVVLDLDPAIHDFLATATVTGSDALGESQQRTELGEFTLFDLTAQHLSRDTTLPLPESTFHYLHVTMSVTNAPGGVAATARFAAAMVTGASAPPSREAQILYTSVAEISSIATVGRESRATFALPMRVPVERVSFILAPGFKGNFSRDVRITALAEQKDNTSGDVRAPLPETMTGTILRVHATEAGREVSSENLDVPAILGANLQAPAKVEIAIENGDDQPLPIASVKLEMRRRELCFDVSQRAPEALALYYGDAKLAGPVYDYDRLFVAAEKPLTAELGPEIANPLFLAPTLPERPFTDRHPEVLWIALIAVICALGMVALRSARNVGR